MTDKKLDTGTGGINIDDKVYTYDVGIERDVADDGAWSGGDVKVDKQARDISKGTRQTLAQYLSNTTLGKTNSVPQQAAATGNRFVIPMADAGPATFSTTTENGNPIGPQIAPDGSFDNKFYDLQDPRPNLPPETKLVDVSRGMIRDGSKDLDGNDLFKFEVEANDDLAATEGLILPVAYVSKKIKVDHPVATYSNAIIKNRWTAVNRFGNVPTADTLRNRPLAAIKYELGASYSPEKYSEASDLKTVSHAQLAGVANTLMARASTEITATSENFDPANAGFQAAASLLPGFGQLGVARVSELVLQAKDVLNDMDLTTTDNDEKSPGIDAANLISIGPGISTALSFDAPLQSWGALNNPFDVFTGLGALGMQILSIAFVVAITIIPAAINPFGLKGKEGPAQALDALSRLPIGRYKQRGKTLPNLSVGALVSGLITGDLDWTVILGFSETVFPLDTCISIGILAFFGLYKPAKGESRAANIGKTLLGATTLSGTEAYLVFSRAIFRSFLLIVDEVVKVGRAFANPMAGVQQLLSFIEFFRSSKIMRSLSTFALLGDQILLYDSRTLDENSKGFGLRSSPIDARATAGDAAYRKSRLIDLNKPAPSSAAKNLRLAWSSFRSPDMLILPKSLYAVSLVDKSLGVPRLLPKIEADDQFGTRTKGDNIHGGVYSVTDADNRISTPDRERFERVLDAEYMPFYFHDVRTNEIISFHAFLGSLGDSYTAGYDSTDAFGRVEAIKTYKNTSRKIDVSFHIAALSPEDFDYMWLKINKLTTLVYPQFSSGKLATTPNYKVNIPFSQQIAAAPLVRLRVGDLIQSNYSRFNLARLFGYSYGNDRYSTDEQVGGADGSVISTGPLPKDMVAKFKEDGKTCVTNGELNFAFEKVGSGLRTFPGTPKYLRLKITKVNQLDPKTNTTSCECTIEIDDEAIFGDDKTKAAEKAALKQQYGSAEVPHSNILGKKCIVNFDDLIPTDKTYNDAIQSQHGLQSIAKYQAAVENFMNPDKNTVVRSFESSGGRGIPGFIESMSFDWYSGVTWEEDRSRGRAPKMCKVTLSFSPFHDITPGLDAKGANRAPVYPIGPLAPRKI